jgi:nicotinate-nucleotide adenylyltransferase
MLAAAIPGDPRLGIDDCEIKREGVSYTIDTIADITRRYRPAGKLGLILGDDLAKDFPKWKNAGEIAGQADIIIARRLLSAEETYPYPHSQLRNEVMEVSSNQVRDRIREGKNWHYLVPQGARIIIEDRRLYGLPVPDGAPAGTDITQALIVEMEEAARRTLNSARFLHSRNTALLAADLCRLFAPQSIPFAPSIPLALDPKAGYLAGITHDMGKHLEEAALLQLAKAGGGKISKLERGKPSLLHGRAGAVLLREQYGLRNQDVLDAVRYHTTGNTAMGPLAKVLYIADKIEVSRGGVDPALRDLSAYTFADPALSAQALDRLFVKVLNETVAWLRLRKRDISEGTIRLLELMERGKSR